MEPFFLSRRKKKKTLQMLKLFIILPVGRCAKWPQANTISTELEKVQNTPPLRVAKVDGIRECGAKNNSIFGIKLERKQKLCKSLNEDCKMCK